TWQAVDPCCNLTNTCNRTVTLVPPPPQLLCTNITIVCGSPIPTNPPVISPCCSSVTVTQLSSTTVTNGCGRTIYQGWRAVDCCGNSVICTQVVTVVAPNTIVAPNANATVEGNSGNIVPFDLTSGGFSSARYQQVYASSQFGTMPAGGAYI